MNKEQKKKNYKLNYCVNKSYAVLNVMVKLYENKNKEKLNNFMNMMLN